MQVAEGGRARDPDQPPDPGTCADQGDVELVGLDPRRPARPPGRRRATPWRPRARPCPDRARCGSLAGTRARGCRGPAGRPRSAAAGARVPRGAKRMKSRRRSERRSRSSGSAITLRASQSSSRIATASALQASGSPPGRPPSCPASGSSRRSRSTSSSRGRCSPSVLIDPEEPCCVLGSMRGRGSLRPARPRRRREGRAARGGAARSPSGTLPRCAHRRDRPDPWDDAGHPEHRGLHPVRRARPRRSVAPVGSLAAPAAGA